jgi:hypothetical protein
LLAGGRHTPESKDDWNLKGRLTTSQSTFDLNAGRPAWENNVRLKMNETCVYGGDSGLRKAASFRALEERASYWSGFGV